jgi:hypothetical protein
MVGEGEKFKFAQIASESATNGPASEDLKIWDKFVNNVRGFFGAEKKEGEYYKRAVESVTNGPASEDLKGVDNFFNKASAIFRSFTRRDSRNSTNNNSVGAGITPIIRNGEKGPSVGGGVKMG